MGIIFNRILKRFNIGKCVFCGFSGNTFLIEKHGIYSDENWFYHRWCLLDILCKPEKYNHKKVDMAIEIGDLIKDLNDKNTKRKEILSLLCKELST